MFLSRDPFAGYATLSISQHPYPYAYAHDNPVNLVDPSGHNALTCPSCFVNSSKYLPRGAGVGATALVAYLAIRAYQQHWMRENPLPDLEEQLDQRLDWLRQVCEDINADNLTRPNPHFDDEPEPRANPVPLPPDWPDPPEDDDFYFYYTDISERVGEMGYLYEDGYPPLGRPAEVIGRELSNYSHIPGIGC